jgi:hypothetical protein
LRHWLNSQAITPNRFNLGQLLFNLKGHLSLIPWVAVTSALGFMVYRSLMNPDQAGHYQEASRSVTGPPIGTDAVVATSSYESGSLHQQRRSGY